ncbi:ribose-phosphate pyrophosphokinase [Dimargaris verticillata]|uniref:ribose-phosphate diphosphokinase n=1 Tax=Dimargaris verticillata TaxID=2761393 RepID=A0A9W8B7F1_9FUNG|nr:ribose-phosphate pyrophosphokinase [Dimargaris verticillata]
MRNIKVFAGSSNLPLAKAICDRLGIALGHANLSKFSNFETNVEIKESVRNQHVYIIQSACGRVNDHLLEVLIMIAACKTASAKTVSVVLPCFPYSRQADVPYDHSRKNRVANVVMKALEGNSALPSPTAGLGGPQVDPLLCSHTSQEETICPPLSPMAQSYFLNQENKGYRQWVARAGTLVANMLAAAGADHIVTMDLHDPQFQGYFDIPVDQIYAEPSIIRYIKSEIPDYAQAVIVSPDAGGAKRATAVCTKLNLAFALVHKESKTNSDQPGMGLVGDVKDKVAIIIDDMADTFGTLGAAAEVLQRHGATKIYAIVTHGILSGPAIDILNSSPLCRLVTTNTVPQSEKQRLSAKVDVIDVSTLFAEAIRRTHNGESVSLLFRS